MTPEELANIAIRRAGADLFHDLKKLEFIYEHPVLKVDQDLVKCFTKFAFKRLHDLCSQHRKGHIGKTDRKIVIGEDVFYISRDGTRHILAMNPHEPAPLRWVPEDLDEILVEFSERLSTRWHIVEDIVSEYRVKRKAGEIAKITVGIVLKDLFVDNLFELMIICRPDDSWWCILHSEEKKKNISFVSGPKTIYDDVRRLIDES